MQYLRPLIFATFGLMVSAHGYAQLPNATDITMTPTAGDHDYIQSPVETVNPSNGSVSVRIPLRIPPGRLLTLPFSIAYDSNGAFYMKNTGSGPEYRAPAASDVTLGGWSYSFPLISYSATTWTIPGNNDNLITCHGSFNYVFQDPAGDRHNLGLSVSANVASPDGTDNCNNGANGDGEFTTGGEGAILATTSVPQSNTGLFPAVTVTDADGTTYAIQNKSPGSGANFVVPSISDRNGNTVSITDSGGQVTYIDTIGRSALSVSGIGGNPDQIRPAGLSTGYQVHWTTAQASFTNEMVNLAPGSGSNCPTAMSASSTVISQVTLPNGQAFDLSYDPTYGMLTKIVYPGGGYVRYVWSLNSQAEAGIFTYTPTNGTEQWWECRYDFPAVSDRYVSFDGQTEVLHQHFSYTTQWSGSNGSLWTQKTTTVTTADNVRNASFTTIYNYTPLTTAYVPNCSSCIFTEQVPVESSIQYKDYSGSLLQTVTKTWKNIRLVQSVQTTSASGLSSLKVDCYNAWEEPTEVDEYDFGTGAPSGPCVTLSGASSGPLLRKTSTLYAPFTSHIVDRPSSITIHDGAGNRVAETDYPTYDAVGNLKTLKTQCFSVPGGTACPQGTSTTTYQYDSHGQITSVTDPNGNPPTQYSYADSYAPCGGAAPVQSPSDAYLSLITYPDGLTKSFCYDYGSGLLLSSTGENNNTTTYAFNDALLRLKEVTLAGNGSTSYSYSDAGPSPSITTTQQMNATQDIVTVTIMDGLGAPHWNETTSDPYGTDTQYATLDGSGRPYQVLNPYRSTSDPTYGLTTYMYDALGRTTSVKFPDNSTATTQYTGNCATSTDAAARARKTCTDGLGRVTSVFEDPAGMNYETDYQYDGNSNLIRVDQWGGQRGNSSERVRVFLYDSLSHLIDACNPETMPSGTSCNTAGTWGRTYNYDPDGDVLSRSDLLSGFTTSYSYDSRNRLLSRTYPSGSTTPSVCFQYSSSSIPNGKGRLAVSWTQTGTCPGTPPTTGLITLKSILGYDALGRETGEQQCTPDSCSTASGPSLSFNYDYAGHVTSMTNSVGAGGNPLTLTSQYDGAGWMSSLTSGWTAFPTTLFSVGQTNGYSPAGQLQNWMNGPNLTVTQSYTNRLWINSISAQGQIP